MLLKRSRLGWLVVAMLTGTVVAQGESQLSVSDGLALSADEVIVSRPNNHTDVPVNGLFYNDPKGAETLDEPHNDAQRVMIDRIMDADPGSVVRIMMYSINDPEIASAIKLKSWWAAGDVTFRVLVSRDRCEDATAAIGFLNDSNRDPSWLRCVEGQGMHQKSITFSSNSDGLQVTLVGSSNMHESSWQDQWNDLYQYADNDEVYSWYRDRFDQIAANLNDPGSVGYVNEVAADGRARADFFPINKSAAIVERTDDPMWRRLDELPLNPGGTNPTQIRVAMWAMDDIRGDWMVDKLIAMQRGGANVKVVAGPAVRNSQKNDMTAAGIAVVNGYEKTPVVCRGETANDTCNFVHLKMVTARYWDNGIWNYRVWTGSSNWNISGLTGNFEVIARLAGEGTWKDYQTLFTAVWNRYSDEWS